MKNHIKKLSMLALVAAFAATAGGCGKSGSLGDDYGSINMEEENTSKIRARMFMKSAEKRTEIGTIAFSERDTGLRMHVNLRDLRPGSDFAVVVYDLTNCDEKKTCDAAGKDGKTKKERMAKRAEWIASCEKVNQNVNTPTLQTDKKGQVRMSFLITGITADEMNNSKVVLTRENRNGEEVAVGWGKLREKK
ncbi:MAG: hypothetical protein LBG89_03100 [Rickettsiales bacterium]|nr:hypothetical protein [Rickettsiales bacterium]